MKAKCIIARGEGGAREGKRGEERRGEGRRGGGRRRVDEDGVYTIGIPPKKGWDLFSVLRGRVGKEKLNGEPRAESCPWPKVILLNVSSCDSFPFWAP